MDHNVQERPAHQQRVINEREELSDRMQKLSDFLPTDACARLPPAERERLRRQLTAMTAYCDILTDRIAAF